MKTERDRLYVCMCVYGMYIDSGMYIDILFLFKQDCLLAHSNNLYF